MSSAELNAPMEGHFNEAHRSYQLGHSFIASQKFRFAEEAFRKAVTLKADFVNAWAMLRMVCRQNNNFAGEYEASRHVVELEPLELFAWKDHVEASLAVGEIEKAFAAFGKVVSLQTSAAETIIGIEPIQKLFIQLCDSISKKASSIHSKDTDGLNKMITLLHNFKQMATDLHIEKHTAVHENYREILYQLILLKRRLNSSDPSLPDMFDEMELMFKPPIGRIKKLGKSIASLRPKKENIQAKSSPPESNVAASSSSSQPSQATIQSSLSSSPPSSDFESPTTLSPHHTTSAGAMTSHVDRSSLLSTTSPKQELAESSSTLTKSTLPDLSPTRKKMIKIFEALVREMDAHEPNYQLISQLYDKINSNNKHNSRYVSQNILTMQLPELTADCLYQSLSKPRMLIHLYQILANLNSNEDPTKLAPVKWSSVQQDDGWTTTDYDSDSGPNSMTVDLRYDVASKFKNGFITQPSVLKTQNQHLIPSSPCNHCNRQDVTSAMNNLLDERDELIDRVAVVSIRQEIEEAAKKVYKIHLADTTGRCSASEEWRSAERENKYVSVPDRLKHLGCSILSLRAQSTFSKREIDGLVATWQMASGLVHNYSSFRIGTALTDQWSTRLENKLIKKFNYGSGACNHSYSKLLENKDLIKADQFVEPTAASSSSTSTSLPLSRELHF